MWLSILPKSHKPSGDLDRVLVLRWIGARHKSSRSNHGARNIDTPRGDNVIYLDWAARASRR